VKAHEFRKWVDTSNTGAVITYHTGFLSVDRVKMVALDSYKPVPEIHDLAMEAIEAFERGKVHLFQRKLSDMKYDYLAMKASKYARNW
jgi:hypothetical protein